MGLPKSIDYTQCIYGLKGPDGDIKYIGHARYAAERLALHKSRARKGTHDHLPVYEWMHTIGLENVKVEIIEKFTTEDIDYVCERETYWISQYRSCSEMTNQSDGGFASYQPAIKRGADHPRFGKALEPDHKAAMAEGRAKSWNAKTDEEKAEYLAKMSEMQKEAWKDRPRVVKEEHRIKSHNGIKEWLATEDPEVIHRIKSRGPHVLHHVNNEKPNPNCQHCINEELV